MTACTARLGDTPTGLLCTRLDDHVPHAGCTYESTSGVSHVAKEE